MPPWSQAGLARQCFGWRLRRARMVLCAELAGATGLGWNDYETEARAAFEALRRVTDRVPSSSPPSTAARCWSARRSRCAPSLGAGAGGDLPHVALPCLLAARRARAVAGRRACAARAGRPRARCCARAVRGQPVTLARWKSAIPRSCSAASCASRPCCWPSPRRPAGAASRSGGDREQAMGDPGDRARADRAPEPPALCLAVAGAPAWRCWRRSRCSGRTLLTG